MPLGLHGRTHHTPARHVYVVAEWLGNEYEMRIHGVIEETSIFGEQLRLTRTITNRLGESGIDIRDIVENIGFNRSPHMMLYHFNFGFPLMSESTTIEWPDGVEARDPGYGPDGIGTWQAPDAEITEQVY